MQTKYFIIVNDLKKRLHVFMGSALKEELIVCIQKPNMKNRNKIAKMAKLQKARQEIIQYFPENYETAVLLLYKSLQKDQYKSIQNSFPKRNQNSNFPQKKTDKNVKIEMAENCFDYLYKQEIPPFYGREWTFSTSHKYYDMLPTPIPHQKSQNFWRWHQRRIFANFYSQNGCNLLLFNQTLTDKRYMIDKARLREGLFVLIRQALLKIQEYISQRLHRQQLVLQSSLIKQLSNKLISLQKYLQPPQIKIWANIVRMNYYLRAEPVTPQEILHFQQTLRDIAFVNEQNKHKLKLESQNLNENFIDEGQQKKELQIDKIIAKVFLSTQNYEICRQKCSALFRNNPLMINITIDQIRKRLQKIIGFTLRKMNYFMQTIGIPKIERIKNHKELHFLTKSPTCFELHIDLLNFFVKPELMNDEAVSKFYQKLKSIRQSVKVEKSKKQKAFCEQQQYKINSLKNNLQFQQPSNGYFANAPLRNPNNRYLSLKSSH